MTWWPFGRKRRKAQTLQPEATPEPPLKTIDRTQTPPVAAAPVESSFIHPALRGEEEATRPMSRPFYSDKEKEVFATPPQSPSGIRSSVENITALPRVMEGSPHLRPVADSDLNASSARREKLPTSTKSTPRRAVIKKDETQRKIDDQMRAERVRDMTTPTKSPKRDRKKDKTLSGNRSASSLSLPGAKSVRSSITGISEHHAFELGSFSIFSARPTIRHSMTASPSSVKGQSEVPSRSVSVKKDDKGKAKEATPDVPRDFSDYKTIDELADDLSPSSIRELMERDQRRQDKKREKEELRARRRLERHAAKVDAAERSKKSGRSKRRQDEGEPVPVAPRRSSRREDEILADAPPVPPLPASEAGPSSLGGLARPETPVAVPEAKRDIETETAKPAILPVTSDSRDDPNLEPEAKTEVARSITPPATSEAAVAPMPVQETEPEIERPSTPPAISEAVIPPKSEREIEPEIARRSTPPVVPEELVAPKPDTETESSIAQPTIRPVTPEPIVAPKPKSAQQAEVEPRQPRGVEASLVAGTTATAVAAAATRRDESPSSLYDGVPSIPARSASRRLKQQVDTPIESVEKAVPAPVTETLEPTRAIEEPTSADAAKAESRTPSDQIDEPMEELETPFEEPVTQMAQVVRYSSASMTPVTSATQHVRQISTGTPVEPPSTREEPVTGPVQPPSTAEKPTEPTVTAPAESQSPKRFSLVDTGVTAPVERTALAPVQTVTAAESAQDDRRASDTSTRATGISALFRRIGTKKGGSTKSQTSERSFTTSRAGTTSLPYQAPHPEWRDAFLERKRSSATPGPQKSKFREDLPEGPSDPGSPELQSIDNTPSDDGPTGETEGAGEGPTAESLGSVDAEGSWLTGRPRKRSSQQMSLTRSSQPSGVASSDDSPVSAEPRPSQSIEETSTHQAASRTGGKGIESADEATAIQQGRVKSNGESNSDEGEGSPTTVELAEVKRATSVRQHVRHVSSGSAKLLEIPSRSLSNRASREISSTPEPPTEEEQSTLAEE